MITNREQPPEWFADRRRCPSWCVGQHQEAFDEGCGLHDAGKHDSIDAVGMLYALSSNGRQVPAGERHLGVQLFELPSIDSGTGGEPKIHLTVASASHVRQIVLPLTAGEARELAAQLVALADMAARA
jgi:hypothetical protein